MVLSSHQISGFSLVLLLSVSTWACVPRPKLQRPAAVESPSPPPPLENPPQVKPADDMAAKAPDKPSTEVLPVAQIPADLCGEQAAFGKLSNTSGAKYVVGGTAVSEKNLAHSSTVKIFKGTAGCTATIIGPNLIVSAAHCFAGATLSQLKIGLGVMGTPSSELIVESFAVHPLYKAGEGFDKPNFNGFHDLALVAFKGKLPAEYAPVVIGSSQELKSGTKIMIAGYGAYFSGDSMPRPLTLLETTIGRLYPEYNEIQLTVGKGIGGCNGDSGGPLFQKYADATRSCLKVYGATHGPGRGVSDNCTTGSGTYTDITAFKSWIKCTAASMQKPLDYLSNDKSQSDCALTTIVR